MILDGKLLARKVEEHLKVQVHELAAQFGRAPGLGVILVGDNPASHAYVGTKKKVAARSGLESFDATLPANSSYADVAAAIDRFNQDARIDGILMQLPLPKGLDAENLLERILPEKDSDGLHSSNQGKLMRGQSGVRPCTPVGCMKLIDLALSGKDLSSPSFSLSTLSAASLKGKRAVVIGRSILVGKPLALLLLERDATVTVAHSKTANLAEIVREADVVVAAVGMPNLVKGEWIKPGAIAIDVGTTRGADGKLVGDIEFEIAEKRAAAITPVPGGVGPMTVAMLMVNTVENFIARNRGVR